MKKGLTVFLLFLFATMYRLADAELSGTVSATGERQDYYEEGEKIQTIDTLLTNLNITYRKDLTDYMSYELFMRGYYKKADMDSIVSGNMTETTRSIGPSLQLMINAPFYNLRTGYQFNLTDRDRDSTEQETTDGLFYSDLNIRPEKLPSFYIHFSDERIRNDFNESLEKDLREYLLSSNYKYERLGFTGEYNLSYNIFKEESPANLIYKKETEQFTGSYKVGYSSYFFQNALRFYGDYKGNFGRTDFTQYSSSTGLVLFKRQTSGGLYALGTVGNPDVNVLSSEVQLVDNDIQTGIGSIDLNAQSYHNIGLYFINPQSVDRLYLYVRSSQDLTIEPNLTTPANWRVFITDDMNSGWNQIALSGLSVTAYDSVNGIYMYEFTISPTEARYFKVINYSTTFGVNPALVTEIEAHGIDTVSSEGRLSYVTRFFQQEVSLGLSYFPRRNMSWEWGFYTKRIDTRPSSLDEPVGKVFANVFNDPDIDMTSENTIEVSRVTYIGLNWGPFDIFSTGARFQRYTIMDTKNQKDFISNSYQLQFRYFPLERFNASLTLLRTDTFEFGRDRARTDSVILSTDAKVLRDLILINDFGYRKSEDYISNTGSEVKYISGSIDAGLTKKIRSYISYGIDWISDPSGSHSLKRTGIMVSYRPGRSFGLTGSFTLTDSRDSESMTEGLSLNWRMTRKLALNSGVFHSETDPEAIKTDSFYSNLTWYLRRSLDLSFSYFFNRQDAEITREVRSMLFRINWRI